MGDWITFSILGLIEGITEFLPISSSGHLIIAREIFRLSADNGLAVDAVLQLATTLAVVVYFWRDIARLVKSACAPLFGRSIPKEDGRLILALIIGTIPGVLFGLLLEHSMETIFRNSHLVAYASLVGSCIMLAADYAAKKRRASGDIGSVGTKRGLIIGLFQSLALVPGMSRSGMTISGGLFLGLSREAAARFGFLLAVPIILGSGLKKLADLGSAGLLDSLGVPFLFGALLAFISGMLAIHFLLKYLRTHSLSVFVIYRVILAAFILFFL